MAGGAVDDREMNICWAEDGGDDDDDGGSGEDSSKSCEDVPLGSEVASRWGTCHVV